MKKEDAKRLAFGLAAYCVRDTFLEELHAGTFPSSQVGDHSDVKVVTPYGEIPWAGLARFDDGGMRTLMKEVVNRLYTVQQRMDDPGFLARIQKARGAPCL